MNILFVHQNYPGQYREILPRLAASGGHRIVFLTQRKDIPKVKDHVIGVYKPAHEPKPDTWIYSKWFETTVGNGVGAAQAFSSLKRKGFTPDIVTGHANWGELIYVKDVWPDTPLVGFFEYYFIPKGGLVGFDPEFPEKPDIAPRLHTNNAPNFLTYVRCDGALTATHWQKSVFPPMLQDKIEVSHEGIRTDRLIPDHDSKASVTFGNTIFRRGEETVTYIARNLEPARGFHSMMRALPRLQELRPNVRVAIIGADDVSYGMKLPEGQTFRGRLVKELGDSVDWKRVHFLGRIPYSQLMALIKLSRCHVYLTAPFVLSWSMMEAMALEKTIVATNVAPVREVLEDGKTAFLIDYFKPLELAERVASVLEHPNNYRQIGEAARRKIVSEYDFISQRYPAFLGHLNRFLPSDKQLELPK
jgi:glycosyltransferase involved in cell wall biosynthesis